MNTNPQRNRQSTPRSQALPVEREFSEGPSQEMIVEHRSIAGFLRMAPHRFHLDEIIRFGKKVGDTAESMQLAYMTTIDSHLGVVRVFPVPLMRRVYDILANQFHWAQFPIELPAAPDEVAAKRELVKSYDKLAALLRAYKDAAVEPDVQACTTVVLQKVDTELVELRAALAEGEADQQVENGGAEATSR